LQAIEPNRISANINNIESISSNLKAITQQIKEGNGAVGSIIYSDNMKNDVLGTTENLRILSEQTKSIIEQTEVLLISIQKQVDQLPEITEKVKPLLDEADKTIKATQQIWPLSSSIAKDNKQTLTTPEATE